jgi:hypothetical protein
MIGLTGGLLVALLLGGLAMLQWQEAEQQRDLALGPVHK